MAGRRALSWSPEAEERVPARPGRRKTLWRDRPKHFPTLEAAGTFAAHRARTTQSRQRVRLEVHGGTCWTVRPTPGTVILIRPAMPGTDAVIADELRRSLDRMAREA